MKYVGFLLHAYQPSWQFPDMLRKIAKECYEPIFTSISEEPLMRFTVNINYALLEQLEKIGLTKTLGKIKKCLTEKKIEITGSGAYHPILPLLPGEEAERQIILNETGFKKVLGKFDKGGFFPPEMAFEKKIACLIRRIGYRWVIADDIPFAAKYGYSPFDFISTTGELPIFLRSSLWSKRIALERNSDGNKFRAEEIVNWLQGDLENWFAGRDGYVIIAMDMETFGHHLPEYRSFLKDFAGAVGNQKGMELVFVSQLLDIFPKREIEVPAGSWSTQVNDLSQDNPYPLWRDRFSQPHEFLWQLVNLALASLKKEDIRTRRLMNLGFNSCQFWWISRDHWDPNLAFRTVPLLVKIIVKDKPENINRANEILAKLEEITQFKISGLL